MKNINKKSPTKTFEDSGDLGDFDDLFGLNEDTGFFSPVSTTDTEPIPSVCRNCGSKEFKWVRCEDPSQKL